LIQDTQKELKRLGYEIGTPDGQLGNNTQIAINHYQKGYKLKKTGNVSNSLLAHLKQATNKPERVAGETFKDCSNCPEMVVIPAGSFQMGSNNGSSDEKPIHRVMIATSFAIGQYEVTWAQYQPCIDAGVCSSDGDKGRGKGNRPVISVNWNDAQTYAKWLSKKTGKQYRLPSESEWEYAARAGSTTKYSWGSDIGCNRAQYDGGIGSACSNYKSTSVGSFKTNAFGLYDMHGNVWEWVQDCYRRSYNGAPSNGKEWPSSTWCPERVLRGGSWFNGPNGLRSANRAEETASKRNVLYGFRLVKGR